MRKFEQRTHVVIENAKSTVAGAEPFYKRSDYEGAALDMARSEARDGEGESRAFVRLLDDGDVRVDALLKAAGRADYFASLNKHHGVQKAQRISKREKAVRLMVETTRLFKRAGETQEQAMTRLLFEDPLFQGAYAAYVEAQ